VKAKNRTFVAKKNMMIVCLSFIVFFIVGYAFAFGNSSGGIVGA
jgi:ammonia channel protein AmtB